MQERPFKPLSQFDKGNWGIAVEFPWGIPVAIKKSMGISLFWRGRPLDGFNPPEASEGFKNWVLETKINWGLLHNNIIIYGRYMPYVCGSIYTKLPDWFIAIDCWDGQKFLDWEEFNLLCNLIGVCKTPVLAKGHFNYDFQSKLGCMDKCGIMVFTKSRKELFRNEEDKVPDFSKYNQRG